MDITMNHDRVELLRAKLDNFTISDYHGLKSPGLTCYLNSVLQVLFMTEDFREAIKRCCSKDSTTIDSLLGKLFSELERSWARTHSITRNLGIADVCRQRDAAEYFEKILCLSSVEASKGCEMTLNPQILSILLKRFSFDHNHRCHVKLHCKVDVPQTLHMEQCTYELYALVNHFGSHRGGHYTAEIKSFETGEWYHFNDDIVERVKQPLFGAGNTSVRSHTAYLLMYRKVSRCPEKTDEVNQEAPFIYSDVKAEGRRDEAEGGEALVPHHQVKDEHCSIGGNLMCLNADMV
ncbi:ubiquitin carboxyl-terminal hydrolase 47-like isoform X3 [Trachinotus anak]|uniref:ubiquitin carboxyl-terminal hydrolase 47-like isoform X3 n=1 Tax=Trachinotus anak TaxID=443729 RepID=UPI0039F22569